MLTELKEKGWVHIRDRVSFDDFEAVIGELGEVVGVDEIKLNVTQRKLHSPQPIPFHTDSAVANLIAWYCIEPGDTPQSTDLVDLHQVLAEMSSDELQALTKVIMRCPNRTHDISYPVPLLQNSRKPYKVFYTPWFSHLSRDQETDFATEKLRQLIKEKAQKISVTLEAGEYFIIDNKRMLHGRSELTPASSRWLSRRWIATEDYDERLIH